MKESFIAIISPIILIIGGIITSILFSKKKSIIISLSIFSLIAILINTWLLINGEITYYPNINGILINYSTAFILEVTYFISFLAIVYSYHYFEDNKELRYFSLLFPLFIATLSIMASSFNLLLMYVSFEASTILGGIIILLTRRRSAVKATMRFFLWSIIGAILIIIGILYQNYTIGNVILNHGISYPEITTILYAIGFGIKIGVFPFGLFWLPAAHSEAPTPMSAVLSGIMVQIAAFTTSRIIGIMSPFNTNIGLFLMIIGILSIITGSLLAVIESIYGSKYSRFHVGMVHIKGIKRIWAFSTCSEVGYFYLLIGLALIYPNLMLFFFSAILLHFLNHGLAKALLFFDSGFVINTSRIADLSLMKGLGRRVGWNGFTYLIGGFSLSLIPGTLGYNTFLEFIKGNINLEIMIIILISAILILFTTLYSFKIIVFGKPKVKIQYIKDIEEHLSLRIPGLILAICIISLGILILLGSNGIFFTEYYHEFENWFKLIAKTICEVE